MSSETRRPTRVVPSSVTKQQLIASLVLLADATRKHDGVLALPMPVARSSLHPTRPVRSPISRGSEVKAADSHESSIARFHPAPSLSPFLSLGIGRDSAFIGASRTVGRQDSHTVRSYCLYSRSIVSPDSAGGGRGRRKEINRRQTHPTDPVIVYHCATPQRRED